MAEQKDQSISPNPDSLLPVNNLTSTDTFGDGEARKSWSTDLTELTEADNMRMIHSIDRLLIHAIGIADDPMHEMRRISVFQAANAWDYSQAVNLDENPLGISRIRLVSTS